MITDMVFPFSVLEFLWDDCGKLESQVHQKRNQLLKYLNKESTHSKATCKSTTSVLLYGLVKFTSVTDENAKMSTK